MTGPNIGALNELALLRLRFTNAARAMGMTPAAIDAECAGFDRAQRQLSKLQEEAGYALEAISASKYPSTHASLQAALRDVQGGAA